MKKIKIGLFGGVFDPIHNGHLFLAEYIRNVLKLDQITFLPAGDISHKALSVASKRDRFNMVCLAEKVNGAFAVNSYDMKKKGLTYTIDTVREMKRLFGKEADFRFLIGADNVKDIKNWKNYRTLTRLIKFVVISRPGNILPMGSILMKNRKGKWEDRKWIESLRAPSLNISATKIRKMIKEGNTAARYMVPEKVWNYIQKKGLYQ